MGFIWSDLTVDGYNYTCTVYLGSLELLKKKKERDTRTRTKMHDGSSNVSIMFDASLMLIS